MRFLLHIDFGSPARLKGRVKYFEYGGVQFKLIRNSAKWANVLLALVDAEDEEAKERAHAAGCEFLSAWCWQLGLPVGARRGGGLTVPMSHTLRQAQCRSFGFPLVAREDRMVGYSISRLPLVETPEQRKALALYREAQYANVVWLSFLFYWHILEVGGRKSTEVVEAIEASANSPIQVHAREELTRLVGSPFSVRGRDLAMYLERDCRHAIAHIRRRKPGWRTLVFDSLVEDRRMAVSVDMAKALAERFMRDELGLTKSVALVRPIGGGFPRYVDLRFIRRGVWETVD